MCAISVFIIQWLLGGIIDFEHIWMCCWFRMCGHIVAILMLDYIAWCLVVIWWLYACFFVFLHHYKQYKIIKNHVKASRGTSYYVKPSIHIIQHSNYIQWDFIEVDNSCILLWKSLFEFFTLHHRNKSHLEMQIMLWPTSSCSNINKILMKLKIGLNSPPITLQVRLRVGKGSIDMETPMKLHSCLRQWRS